MSVSASVMKDSGRSQSYRKILVGYDGSDNAKRALTRAIALAKESGGDLRIVVAADTISYMARSMGQFYVSIRDITIENAKTILSQGSDTAKQAGLKGVYGSVEEGNPADMILAYALETKADLIVVGRRGIRGIERFLMGSVSSSVVSHSECDVLVVK